VDVNASNVEIQVWASTQDCQDPSETRRSRSRAEIES